MPGGVVQQVVHSLAQPVPDVDAADIDTVVLTHVPLPDHSGALFDMTSGRRNFPNAELVMHENEIAHWFDDAKMAAGSEREKRLFFQAGRDQLAPYKDRWRPFKSGEVFPGVTAIPRPGHTPGHTTYMISSGKEQLLIWGDTIHVQELQTAHPEVCLDFDVDKELAINSRRQVFDMVATDKLLFTGMHMHFQRGESDIWVAGKLHDVAHPAAAKATTLLRQGQRRRAHVLLETALGLLAGAADGNELDWFSKAGLCSDRR